MWCRVSAPVWTWRGSATRQQSSYFFFRCHDGLTNQPEPAEGNVAFLLIRCPTNGESLQPVQSRGIDDEWPGSCFELLGMPRELVGDGLEGFVEDGLDHTQVSLADLGQPVGCVLGQLKVILIRARPLESSEEQS